MLTINQTFIEALNIWRDGVLLNPYVPDIKTDLHKTYKKDSGGVERSSKRKWTSSGCYIIKLQNNTSLM